MVISMGVLCRRKPSIVLRERALIPQLGASQLIRQRFLDVGLYRNLQSLVVRLCGNFLGFMAGRGLVEMSCVCGRTAREWTASYK